MILFYYCFSLINQYIAGVCIYDQVRYSWHGVISQNE